MVTPVEKARRRTLYLLIFINLLLIAALIVLISVVAGLRHDVRQSAISVNVGCKRGNVQRDSVRFLLLGRLHDAQLVAIASVNKDIAAYFLAEQVQAKKKLEAALAASKATFADEKDPYLVDCDKSFPLP